ncbi:fibrillin-2-like [Anopheles ziemanni]|uniref:fibrillin-2-like n=1 Tax=Anopheles coustani TaxID=139045 RepID=UPI002657AC3B|nr:fibrillin-2-like [Anopheles coustani]XP_058168753.1 fibrillin-2-like [Anopheles ziemanni]
MIGLRFTVTGFLLVMALSTTVFAATCSNTTATIRIEMKNGKRKPIIETPCCSGYKRQRDRKCIPICSQACENAICTAPEYCTCKPGFTKLSDYRCIPHCEDCDNGICTRPGFCQCHYGYTKAENGACVPECNNCANGFCSDPNVCQCHDGYEFQGFGEARSCRPVCKGGCLNGQCIAPDECLCAEGFTNDGSTDECVPVTSPKPPPPRCQEGYEERDSEDAGNVTCVPICSEPCRNGTCVAPDRCECLAGFSTENSTSPFVCQPVCSGGCVHGDCVAPGKCICHAQYGKIGDECIPLCEKCSLGQCVAPNVCECDRGYRLIEGDCEPICETECKNAVCTGPNACTCLPGYNYTDINALFDCLPVCDEECINGKCVAPQTCQCNEGYVQDEDVRSKCLHPVEVCRKRCSNGQCHGAECYCDSGYVKSPTDGHCEKTCQFGCTNGDCNAGECLCHDGYRLSSDNSSLCEPICGEDYDYAGTGCVNGRCVRPNVCQCDDGYEFVDANQTRCESSEEIARKRQLKERVAKCKQNCMNGMCSGGQCVCFTGYGQPEGNPCTCVASCKEPCQNGTCVKPDRCECLTGFEFVEGSNSVCRSKEDLAREANELCESRCQNGACGDGICHCMIGYRASPEDPFVCLAVCNRPCVNGTCAGNDRCHCAEGYSLSVTDDHLCEPICYPPCSNGACVGPDQCACHPGHIPGEDKNSCKREETPEEKAARVRQAECLRECRNGVCAEGVCKCVEGFYHEQGNVLRCEPFCEKPCEAGRCIGNNTCECFKQYVLTEKFVCSPVCTVDCGNGVCVEPNVCRCNEGYEMSLDNQCKPVCGPTGCTKGECVGPNECVCLNGYVPDEEDPTVCHLEPKVIVQSYEQSANNDYFKISYIHYFIPVIAAAALIAAILIGKLIVRNRQKNYHVGKLGNVARRRTADRKRAGGKAFGKRAPDDRTTDYNDYNLVVLFPTESKENCVYFMPNPHSQTDELTKLNLEIETI